MVLKINLRYIKMCPCRQRHLLPAAEGIKTELEHPLGFLFFSRNQADYIFIQALGNKLLFDIGNEAVFILFIRKTV